MKFSKEQLERAMNCKSSAELKQFADTQGLDMTTEEAEKYFAQLSGRELDPNDIGSIAGGCLSAFCAGNVGTVC